MFRFKRYEALVGVVKPYLQPPGNFTLRSPPAVAQPILAQARMMPTLELHPSSSKRRLLDGIFMNGSYWMSAKHGKAGIPERLNWMIVVIEEAHDDVSSSGIGSLL